MTERQHLEERNARLMMNAFRRAATLHVRLQMTPRWRWRRRAMLDAELAAACAEADRARNAIGKAPGGRGLRAVLEDRDG